MNLLAIDTATERFSVALASKRNERRDVWLFEADAGMRHSELVMDGVEILVRKAELGPRDIDGVVCMGGPGSFTGLRIGFSLAKGLALSLGVPFAPVPTLDCLARPLSAWPGIAVPVIDAKKKAFFCALYREGKRIGPDMDASPREVAAALAERFLSQTGGGAPERALLFGPGAEALFRELALLTDDNLGVARVKAAVVYGKTARPGNAETLLEIALETGIFADGGNAKNGDRLFAGPEYIRKSDAELNLESGDRR